jgi:hypothetical protein
MTPWFPVERKSMNVLNVVASGTRRRSLSALALCVASVVWIATTAPASAATTTGLTNNIIQAIAVSPVYGRTGLVVAEGFMAGCKQGCIRLWVSHDGGVTWQTAAGNGYGGGIPLSIVVDGQGREVILAPNGSTHGYQTSGDDGQTWSSGALAGRPTAAPTYTQDRTLAVAGGSVDALFSNSGRTAIQGSSGSYADSNFVYMPGFPSTGTRAPALLGAVNSQSGMPVVLRCHQDLTCTNAVALANSNSFSGPPEMVAAADYATTGAVFAETTSGVYRSTDGGLSFVLLTVDQGVVGSTNAFTGLALAPGYRENGPVRTIFAGVIQAPPQSKTAGVQSAGGVFRSDDGGTTWKDASPGTQLSRGVQAMAIAPDGRLYASYFNGTDAGLLCSDNAQTWSATCASRGGSSAASRSSSASVATGGNSHQAPAAQGGQSSPVPEAAASAAPTASVDGDAAGALGAGNPPGGRGGPSPALLIAALMMAVAAGSVGLVVVRRRASRASVPATPQRPQ